MDAGTMYAARVIHELERMEEAVLDDDSPYVDWKCAALYGAALDEIDRTMDDLREGIRAGKIGHGLLRLTQCRLLSIADLLNRVGDRKRALQAARELEEE